MFLYIKKSERIKAYWTDTSAVRRGSMVVMTVCFNTHIRKSVLKLSGWCNGSMTVSKTVRGGSSPSLDAKLKYTACPTVKVVINYKLVGSTPPPRGLVVYFNLG